MRAAVILAIVGALVGAGSATGAPFATRAPAARMPQTALGSRAVTHMPTLEERVIDAINQLRREHGLAALRVNSGLTATAREHSLSMAEQGYFRHSSLDGSPFWSRVEAKYGGRRWSVGENLAWASPRLTAELAIAMWLKSPPHRWILLSPDWREIGLGAVHSDVAPGVYEGLAATILTADFGVRR